MGGMGSGSWHRWYSRGYLDDNINIDIHYLKREGLFIAGSMFFLNWKVNDVIKSRVQVEVKNESIILSYSYRINNGDWNDVEQVVQLTYTDCNYGGRRAWFRCSNCGSRVAKLFVQNPHFVCRHCCNLNYRSQSESISDRSHRKAIDIRRKLKFDPERKLPIAYMPKPKGMHWKTFEKLRQQGMRAEQMYVALLNEQLDQIKEQITNKRIQPITILNE